MRYIWIFLNSVGRTATAGFDLVFKPLTCCFVPPQHYYAFINVYKCIPSQKKELLNRSLNSRAAGTLVYFADDGYRSLAASTSAANKWKNETKKNELITLSLSSRLYWSMIIVFRACVCVTGPFSQCKRPQQWELNKNNHIRQHLWPLFSKQRTYLIMFIFVICSAVTLKQTHY